MMHEIEKSLNIAAILASASSQIEVMKNAISLLQGENEIMKPKAEAYDLLEGSRDAMDMSVAASRIGEAIGIELGCKRLYSMLRVLGIVCQSANRAKQSYVDAGYLKNVAPVRNGRMRESVKVTAKGMTWLVKKIGEYQSIGVIE